VIRVYHPTKLQLEDVECAAAGKGEAAKVTFEATRGDSYLIVVGRRPGTPAEPFTFTTKLFLPPANDGIREAKRLGPLPLNVTGTTIAATSEDSDPTSCGLSGNTVWYSLAPSPGQRIVLRTHTDASFDAAVVVLRKVRSETNMVVCGQTNASGDLVVAWDTAKQSTYLIVIGTRENASPGDFTFKAIAPATREKAPGIKLTTRGQVRATVDWLSDPNDFYWTNFAAGVTYRIAFTSACAHLTVTGPYAELKSIGCNGFTTFTPGPDGAGRYVFEITAPHHPGTVGYRLVVLKAGLDDMGLGRLVQNLHTVHGSLWPAAADVVDLYHFTVTGTTSDVRLRLGTRPHSGIELQLLDDSGNEIATSSHQIRENLGPGRYVFAVRSSFTEPGGGYAVWLVIRTLTTTTLTLPQKAITLGTAVSPTLVTTPSPDMGKVTYQVDRLDPLEGWVFNRMITVKLGARITWTPPALGQWRMRARYLGSLKFSPSVSEYSGVTVTEPAL
jgi:hypothetical protein